MHYIIFMGSFFLTLRLFPLRLSSMLYSSVYNLFALIGRKAPFSLSLSLSSKMEKFGALITYVFVAVAARPASIRNVRAYMPQESTEETYSCKIGYRYAANSFVLTAKLAPNARTLTIYGWKEEYVLIVEEAVVKNINLVGKVDCQQIVIISRHSSIRQCLRSLLHNIFKKNMVNFP